MKRTAIPFAPALLLMLATSLQAAGQEPTSKDLWGQLPPPFKVYADGFSSKGIECAARDDKPIIHSWVTSLPWLIAPKDPQPMRLAEMEKAASYSAMRYVDLGLRPPVLDIRDGKFSIYFVHDLGGAAAAYGPGYGELGVSEVRRIWKDDWDQVIGVSEVEGFGKDLGIFPESVAASIGHELFHAIQPSYPHWSVQGDGNSVDEFWVTEALPEALGLWSIEGLSFLGNPPFHPRRRLASGNRRFGMTLGMRPYDYPLDARIAPARIPIDVRGSRRRENNCERVIAPPDEGRRRTLAAYMTSSFWGYVWQHSMPRGQAWKPLPRAMLMRRARMGTANAREDSLAWADNSLRDYHPAWTRGLYDALPAFIPWWVAFPDEVMRSRRGEFKHARWLGHAFVDGCPLYELNEASPTVTIPVEVRELAAYCVRVKWTGASVGKSGWPAAALVVVPKDGGGEVALSDLHLGMHGINLGKTSPFTDPASGLPSLAWSGLSIDPKHPDKTEGETVITFTNVARDPFDTKRRAYEVHLGMATAEVSGQLEKPAEKGVRPASSARVDSVKRALPAQVVPVPPGKSLSIALSAPAAGKDDCSNATAKSAGMLALGMDKTAARAGAPNLMTICLDVATRATRASLRPPNQPEVSLQLPAVPDGHTGTIAGGRVIATWTDPGLGERGKQHVDARTRNVEITIAQANPAFVRGSFRASFSAPGDGANGELSGDFLTWRAPTEQRLPLADPIDFASSDLLQTFAAMGRSPEEMRSQLGQRKPPQTPGAASASGGVCPMECEALRQGEVSASCRQMLAAVYDACPKGEAASRDDVVELATWLYRKAPEPQRTQMIQATVDGIMAMPGALREDWVRKQRAKRDAAGD